MTFVLPIKIVDKFISDLKILSLKVSKLNLVFLQNILSVKV